MRIKHIPIYTRDIENSKKFYVDYFNGTAEDRYFVIFESSDLFEIIQTPFIPDNLDNTINQQLSTSYGYFCR